MVKVCSLISRKIGRVRTEDAMSIAPLRSGHSLELRGYRCRINLEGGALCQMCGLESESVEHVVECGAGCRMR